MQDEEEDNTLPLNLEGNEAPLTPYAVSFGEKSKPSPNSNTRDGELECAID